ncbi:uncharacterized protein LOC126046493 isoform X5 [Accipiter gentilis]|uniref:uncharacterized protein LOC126046493 isoform X5 n=1 Tax=Astur gentilis TaxID=8957 RepID=UPI00210F273E|nr:uncharacterized protein LOC126046493 isoform X5 [Accipiter gentilis]
MEALRAAGRAVLRSPRLARHGLGLRRRRKLPESWADMQEPLLEGMCFTLKYLGMTLVEKPKGEDMAAAAIRRIVATDLLLHNRQAAEQSLRLCCPEPGQRGTGVPCLPLTQEEDCPGCDSDCGPGLPDGTGSLGSSTCRRRKRRRKMITSVKPYLAWRRWGREPTAQQSQHFLCPGQALLLHSCCATAWGNPQTAGRGWEGLETSPQLALGLLAPRLPWAKPNLCSNGPATQDSPCACTWARQCLPLPRHCPPGMGSAGTAAMQRTDCDTCSLSCSPPA